MKENQVFSTHSPRRWQRVKWLFRVLLVVLIVPVSIYIYSILVPSQPKLPMLFNKYIDYKAQINKDSLVNNNSMHTSYTQNRHVVAQHTFKKRDPLPKDQRIRAAFYVNWDLQSYYSLRDNINELNMVLPEWLFVNESDTVATDIDDRALNVLRQHAHVQIVPMLSDYWKEKWRGENVIRIIHSPAKREKFIQSIIAVLKKHNFQGINIDFESLDSEKDNSYLTVFQHELYDKLHAQGFIVNQDVNALNDDYDLQALSMCNDQLFLMAYDLHNDESDPGDIAPQKWVENIIDLTTKKIAPEKLVLCIPGYGYDWGKKGTPAEDISFQEAIAIAKESDASITFDNDTYNLHFNYVDDDSVLHSVYFADAATNFNAMRAADDAGLKGVALWRLGGEDPRLWSFFNKRISNSSEGDADFDISELKSSLISSNIDYIGEGEILEVLTEPHDGKVDVTFNSDDRTIAEENYAVLPTSYVIRKFGKAKGKKLVLTFDDGPSAEWTPQILKILKEKNVPAAFFMVGKNAEANLPLVKTIFKDGYEIGNHSYSHPNMAEIPLWRSRLEINATGRLIESITGHSTILFRAPYLADAEPETREELAPVIIAKHLNYFNVGESIDARDWEPGVSPDSILARCIAEQSYGSMILLHDAGGDRSATVKILPRLIDYFRAQGYEFTTVASLMGKTKEGVMPPIPSNQSLLDQVDSTAAVIFYNLQRILFGIFYSAIIISILRILFILYFAVKQHRKEEREKSLVSKTVNVSPSVGVSIIVPAYNEAITAVKTVESLLKQEYPLFEILFIDDGSKDNTYEVVKNAFENNERVKIVTKENGGKASALNYGIAQAQYPFLVCIDADTMLAIDAVQKLMQPFCDEQVAAVAGNVKVGNKVNMLTQWQSIEYITAQNFDRLAFAYLNAITVVPGAIGAFRKSAVDEIEGFATDTLAEDCDLTMRLLRAGYKVTTANDAIAITEAPENYGQFLKQRFRWTFGVMQAFWKNRYTFLQRDFGGLGMVAMPNILLFQFLLPLFSPLADLILIYGLFTGSALKLVAVYFLLMLIDLVCGIVAFRFEKQPLGKLIYLFPQRLVYRPLMYWVLFKSYRKAFKGELQSWGALLRTGRAQ